MSDKAQLANRFHMDIFQAGNLDAANEIVTADFKWHGGMAPPMDPCGPEGVKAVASAIMAGFPDRKITHHDTMVDGDKVLIRWSMSGTYTGELMGMAPTNKSMTVTGFDQFRLADGKIAEMWQEADQLSMLKQLGVIPLAEAGTRGGHA
jgi:predicted ester cyclase